MLVRRFELVLSAAIAHLFVRRHGASVAFMALIIRGKTECVLCHEVIASDDDIVATSHFIADQKDSLWKYSDAAFHRRCFAAWETRDEFIQRFNDAVRPFVFGNGKRHHMQDDGDIVQVEP